ncbi:hypothetical protein BDF19DRAFT_466566 [Syncephalis fuscata]|nr:hypothetical protein BDF19DRAFT_466566 [Syncephalis fuscata]
MVDFKLSAISAVIAVVLLSNVQNAVARPGLFDIFNKDVPFLGYSKNKDSPFAMRGLDIYKTHPSDQPIQFASATIGSSPKKEVTIACSSKALYKSNRLGAAFDHLIANSYSANNPTKPGEQYINGPIGRLDVNAPECRHTSECSPEKSYVCHYFSAACEAPLPEYLKLIDTNPKLVSGDATNAAKGVIKQIIEGLQYMRNIGVIYNMNHPYICVNMPGKVSFFFRETISFKGASFWNDFIRENSVKTLNDGLKKALTQYYQSAYPPRLITSDIEPRVTSATNGLLLNNDWSFQPYRQSSQ